MPAVDTTPEARRVLTQVFRAQSPAQKWQILAASYRRARLLHAMGVRARQPGATPEAILRDWLHRILGRPDVQPSEEAVMDLTRLGLGEALEVIRAFESLGIRCVLGGSLASSIHGEARSTNDADLTVPEFSGREAALVATLGSHWYVSLTAIEDAHRRHSSFNLIHNNTGFKVDVFVCEPGGFADDAISRGILLPLADAPEEQVRVLTPEDVVLHKLIWFQLGDQVSDRQWGDILGVLRTQGDRLDKAHLDTWAKKLGVLDLLERARKESQE